MCAVQESIGPGFESLAAFPDFFGAGTPEAVLKSPRALPGTVAAFLSL